MVLEPQVPKPLCFYMVLTTVPTRCQRYMFKNLVFYMVLEPLEGYLKLPGSILEPVGAT